MSIPPSTKAQARDDSGQRERVVQYIKEESYVSKQTGKNKCRTRRWCPRSFRDVMLVPERC
jgi:hypothetical protein